MSGFAALRKLRRHPATKSVPVIMISGNPHAVVKFYQERVGADGFMKKPFGRYEVFSHIERLVSNGALPERCFTMACLSHACGRGRMVPSLCLPLRRSLSAGRRLAVAR